MIALRPAQFAIDFLFYVNAQIKAESKSGGLTNTQRYWLAFCLTAILLTNQVCWAAYARLSLANIKKSRMSWMFRWSKIPWDILVAHSVKAVLRYYGIRSGTLVIDDTDRERSKNVKKIGKVHTIKDKRTGGYFRGQNIIFLLLVTDKITIPVGFHFYEPDPEDRKWRKEDKRLRKQKVPKAVRPQRPARNPGYPTKQGSALALLREFSNDHHEVRINCILADALYGTAHFIREASKICPQVISQIRKNQIIRSRGKNKSVKSRFQGAGLKQSLRIRGQDPKEVNIVGARLFVRAHGVERFIIALKYEGEAEFRYLIASDLTWRLTDIVKAFTLRWLVEVFIEDWKSNEGWCKMAKQPGIEGSSRSLILSLLTDHCLLFHKTQKAFLSNKLPARTVGSLRAKICFDSAIDFVHQILQSDNPKETLKKCETQLCEVVELHASAKHAHNWDVGKMEPSPSLEKNMLLKN